MIATPDTPEANPDVQHFAQDTCEPAEIDFAGEYPPLSHCYKCEAASALQKIQAE